MLRGAVQTPTALAGNDNDDVRLVAASRQVIVLYHTEATPGGIPFFDRDHIVRFVPLSELDAPVYRYHFTLTNSVKPTIHDESGIARDTIPAAFSDDERTLFCLDQRRHVTGFNLALTRIRSENTHFTLRTQVDYFNTRKLSRQRFIELAYYNDELTIICGNFTVVRTYAVVFDGVSECRLICRHTVDASLSFAGYLISPGGLGCPLMRHRPPGQGLPWVDPVTTRAAPRQQVNRLTDDVHCAAVTSSKWPLLSYRTSNGVAVYNLVDGRTENITIKPENDHMRAHSNYIKQATDGRLFLVICKELFIIWRSWPSLQERAQAACWQLLRPEHQLRVFEKYPANDFTSYARVCYGIGDS